MIPLTIGNIYSTVEVPLEKDLHNIGAALQKILTVDVPGAKFLWAYKSGEWDGRARLFNLNRDARGFTFFTGLCGRVLQALNHAGYVPQIVDKRGLTTPQLNQYTVPLRPYQHNVLSRAFSNMFHDVGWWPRGVLHVATGGGKTELAVAMYQCYPVPTVFLVHRKDLLLQAEDRFQKYGIKAGIVGAGRFEPSYNLNIVTMQTLISKLSKPGPESMRLNSIITNAQQVFFDESHVIASSQEKGNQFSEIGVLFNNAHARWGLTATPFMRDQYDNMLLEGITGYILAEVTAEYLITNGYLAPPEVKIIDVPGKLPVKVNFKASTKAKAKYWREVEYKGITANDWRNERIAKETVVGPHPCIVLVKTIEQAHSVKRFCAKHGMNVDVLDGKCPAQQRRHAVSDLRSGTRRAIIATTIFDEGVDIPELRKVILGSGGKSQVKLLQRVGRGLRRAPGKKTVEIIDFADQHHSMLKRHADSRMKIWRDQGFKPRGE